MSATFITVIEREEKGKLYFTCETKKNLAGERDKRFGEDKKGMRITLIMIKKKILSKLPRVYLLNSNAENR